MTDGKPELTYKGFENCNGLLLPSKVITALAEAQDAKADELEKHREAQRKKRQAATVWESDSGYEESPSFHGPLRPNEVRIIDVSPASREEGWADVIYTDTADKQRRLALNKYLQKRGPIRRLVPLARNWREILVRLQVEMPNFADAIDLLRAEFALIEGTDAQMSMPPILLVGAPGIGKSMFAESLAAAFGTPQYRVQMEAAETGNSLSGSAEFWSNAKTGMVFEALVGGEVANPIFLLDELDKAAVPRHYTSPYDPLHALWERKSAADFRDSSMPHASVDASHIWWIATANSLDPIPLPILSRCHVVVVGEMDLKDAIRVVHRIYEQMSTELRLRMQPLAEGVAERLARSSPRSIKKALRLALGRARYFKRDRVLAEDIPQAQSAGAFEADGAGRA